MSSTKEFELWEGPSKDHTCSVWFLLVGWLVYGV